MRFLCIGKSTLIKRFVDNIIPNLENPKMIFQSFEDEIILKNYYYQNEDLKISFIDTPGQNEFTPFLHNRYVIGILFLHM